MEVACSTFVISSRIGGLSQLLTFLVASWQVAELSQGEPAFHVTE